MSSLARTPPFRWGIIGPGKIAAQFAQALEVVEHSCLHAVAGRTRSRAEQFARQYGARVCYGTHHELLDDPDIDAVYIAAPHPSHYALSRDCLLAGKPVLCEKPLTVNAREAQHLVALSIETGVFLMEALWTRFLPIYEQVNQWLVAGKIGTVTSIKSSFGFAAPRIPQGRLLNLDMAGGALLDLGVYNLSMSQWVFGAEPAAHVIDGYLGETGVDEHDEIALSYGGGCSSTFTCSLTRQLDNDFIIRGSKGRIRVHEMFWGATEATLFPNDNLAEEHSSETIRRPFRATGLEYEIEAAQLSIRKGRRECPGMPHSDTLATMRLMDALRHDMGLVYDFDR